MSDHCLKVLAGSVVTATLALGIASEAAAGGCCPGIYASCGCGPVVEQVLVAPVVMDEMYLVNQGPVFSGPGHNLPRQFPDEPPGAYPYVGYVYSGYPYGLQDSGGYPRGAYSPFTGYPYAEPLPRGAYRVRHRSVRAYPRHLR
jgi:hypothetical protein